MRKPKPKKTRLWLYVDEKILSWVYEKMEKKEYSDESHCFERLVMEKMNSEEVNGAK
ncbi:MAG: hypothetical protein V1859_01685 [archaeon]